MNSMKQSLGLLTLSAGMLLVNAKNPWGEAHAQTADHSSTTVAGETTQAKIARAMSAGPDSRDLFWNSALLNTGIWR